MKWRGVWLTFVLALVFSATAQAQDIDITVELQSALSDQTSRPGDQISARVISPNTLAGDIVEGKVNEAKSGNKVRGQAVLSFSFETLKHGSEAIPISAVVKSVTNSKGQVDVDEEGRLINKKSNVGKALGGTALGGLIGGVAGGAKGAAIGALVGGAASVVLIQMAAEGPSVRFDAGSRFVLSAKSRSGSSLSSLRANEQTAAGSTSSTTAVSQGAAAPSSSKASVQPDLMTIKADFIPGEKALFFDDFSDMAGDEAPPHWKVRGGSVALKVGPGVRQLQVMTDRLSLTPMLQGLPRNFTVETETKFDDANDVRSVWYFHDKTWSGPLGPDAALRIFTAAKGSELNVSVRYSGKDGVEDIAEKSVPVDFSQVVKQAFWVQNGRLRIYVNGERIVDVNQIELPALTGAELDPEGGENRIGYRMVRFAESGPDFSQSIIVSGRYVTHGIYFDTDSDRIQPESAAVVKAVAAGLQKSPGLKLRISGHTDSTGSVEHNIDLSKRRAEAVKTVLVSQFGIEEVRLSTEGMGASKPIDSNETTDGRAQNRRVEFVKQ